MGRKAIIAANWKMHKTQHDALQFVQKLNYLLRPADFERVEIPICGPFTVLRTLQTVFDADKLHFRLGAQDVFWEEKGAYTGAISGPMLAALAVDFVIVGHSERRAIFGDTDKTVRKKIETVFKNGMTPIMCCGETEAEREAGETAAKVTRQVQAGVAGLSAEQVGQMVIAYEPIWAIGTGKTATPEDAQETCGLIRKVVAAAAGDTAAAALRVQYGGSVKPGNVEMIMAQPDIDGALVGGASLDPKDFSMILTGW